MSRPAIFFDNPAGTQVPCSTVERISRYLVEHNANHEGAFAASRASDSLVDEARAAAADFLNAGRKEEVVFG